MQEKLQELLNQADESIKAVVVTGQSIFTCSDGSNPMAIMFFTYKVEKLFEIEKGTSGGSNFKDMARLEKIEGISAKRS